MNKIFTNMNKIISKLPNKINYIFYKKINNNCNVGNIIKLKLMESIYFDVRPEDIIQTLIHLFNNSGKGIFLI